MNERTGPGRADTREGERAPREYPHGSGDRNTHPEDDERGKFHGGEQRETGHEGSPRDAGRS